MDEPAGDAGGRAGDGPAAGGAHEQVTVRLTVSSSERMRELGRRLAGLLRAGDLVLLTGELGAGKTTLTRGIGAGLGVRGAVTSPTFVIARVHPSLVEGPPLVHVDAYRLGWGAAESGAASDGWLDEMEDLDLDVTLPESVVVVEWGEGKVESLADERLHVVITRTLGDTADGAHHAGGEGQAGEVDDVREVALVGVGARWSAPLRGFTG